MGDRKVAVVTGGTRGIGRAITVELASMGIHVAAGYSAHQEAAEMTRKIVEEAGGSVSLHRGNVGEPGDCVRVVEEVVAEHGRLDYLINNAGINVDRTVRKMTIDEWHAVMRINISGAFYMIKASLEHLLAQGAGRIVNISSVIGQTGNIGQANYATAKAGMFGLTKTLALELANKNITVNCVAPGFIDTDMMASVPEAALEKVIEKVPVRRLGKPEEVAFAVRYLLDDRAGYVTGAIIPVNGGLEM
jgi:acetoacetyl-CoA reductase